MNPHALHVLQYGQVLDVVAGFAGSTLGAAAVRALTPLGDRAWIEGELSRVAAVRALTASDDGWSSSPVPDVARSLARLRVEGTGLSGGELLGLAQLLRSARTTAETLSSPRQPLIARGVLASIRERLISDPGAEQAIDGAIDDDGSVKDAASPTLRRTRRDLRSARGDLVGLLERVMARLEPHQRVMDASVTMRNGRYVIPVRREARGTVGGIVQDASGSGATLFVEQSHPGA
jgi:DNA mismatch repair protein MutS2